MTHWYCYSGSVEGPFFETKQEAREALSEGERLRPIADSLVELREADDEEQESEDAPDYSSMSHDELKAEAKARGIAEETDLRTKETIIEALQRL